MTGSRSDIDVLLAKLRGSARERKPNVRALAQFAATSDCSLSTLGFAARVDFDTILQGTRYEVPYGQSPFAFRRGNVFEQRLRTDGHAPIRDLLRERLKLQIEPSRVKNIREEPSFNHAQMQHRADVTTSLMREIVRRAPNAPQLLDGAVLTREIGGRPAYFEADAVAVHTSDDIRAGEIKSFPTIDGQADPEKVGAAVAQVAIYVLLLRELVQQIGGPADRVSSQALLITPKNTGLQPALSVFDVRRHVDRAERILARVPNANDIVTALPDGLPSFGKVHEGPSEAARVEAALELAERVKTRFSPECLSTCGMSRLCRERAQTCGDPARYGSQLVRLLPGLESVDRVSVLAEGGKPKEDEAAVAEQLIRVERLRKRFCGGGAA